VKNRNNQRIFLKREYMEQIRILLVDDEEEFVKTLSERIQMRNLDSTTALNGKEAMEAMNARLSDVMVLDLRMPGMDGFEVLRQVKKTYPEVQVIILTGHGSDKDENETRRLGAFEYLKKPVGIDQLIQTIHRAYESKI